MDNVNIYTCVEQKGMPPCDRKAGYILELIKEGRQPITLTNFITLKNVTNRQAELRVLIGALERMIKPAALCIYQVSTYVAAGYTCNWVEDWKANGWQTKHGTPVVNAEEWQKLDKLLAGHRVKWMLTENHQYKRWMEREVRDAETDKKAPVLSGGA
jgi:ribonuclease HI